MVVREWSVILIPVSWFCQCFWPSWYLLFCRAKSVLCLEGLCGAYTERAVWKKHRDIEYLVEPVEHDEVVSIHRRKIISVLLPIPVYERLLKASQRNFDPVIDSLGWLSTHSEPISPFWAVHKYPHYVIYRYDISMEWKNGTIGCSRGYMGCVKHSHQSNIYGSKLCPSVPRRGLHNL